MKTGSRPFLSASIDQLEATLEDALAGNDRSRISQIQHELTFRRVPRAKDLADRISKAAQAPSGERAASHRSQPKAAASAFAGKRDQPKPTSEQQCAIDAFGTGGSLKINAFAGAGKTSTLQMLSHTTNRRGQYIAFNRSIVTDAKDKFPQSVNCSTTHGLAFRATPAEFRQNSEKMTGKLSAQKLAEILDLKKTWRIDEQHVLPPRSLAYLILDTVRRYGQSGDEHIGDAHVPLHGSLASASAETIGRVNDFARRGAEHVWSRMCDPADPLPLGHDGYLKLWALSRPQIAADFILLDEAQDTSPVVLEVLRAQSAQLIYVGDQHQQIYEWRGAVNAMAAMKTDHSVILSQSFRFGPEIARAATCVLNRLGERVPLRGNPNLRSAVGSCEPNTILARTNASIMSELITALDAGKKAHLVGGAAELIAMLRGVSELKAGSPSVVPDFFGFSSWKEVVEFAKTQEGQHLQTFVNLVESHGEKQLIWALNRTVDEADADVILSTAHKAKGREWNKVRLSNDFLPGRPPHRADKAPACDGQAESEKEAAEETSELRLFYVAMTRAREVIDIPPNIAATLGLAITEAPPFRSSSPETMHRTSERSKPAWQRPTDWQPPGRAVVQARPSRGAITIGSKIAVAKAFKRPSGMALWIELRIGVMR